MLPLNDSNIMFVNRDFAALLGLLVFFCFFVRLVRLKYPEFLMSPSLVSVPVNFIVNGFLEIFIIFIIRAFFFEMYLIPSGSMQPTVYPGDLVLVNKFSYGLKIPGTNETFFQWGQPEYGDAVVFLDPTQPTVRKMIKRMVARGGDHIKIESERVWLNGQELSREFLYQSFEYVVPQLPRFENHFYQQKLPNRSFVIESIPALQKKISIEMTIPKGYYFVLGDNRDNSIDSRYWGLVPERFLCGKAQYILMSFGQTEERQSFDRIGKLT